MQIALLETALIEHGLSEEQAQHVITTVSSITQKSTDKAEQWSLICRSLLNKQRYPFAVQRYIFTTLYPDWPENITAGPAWSPDATSIIHSNLHQFMTTQQFDEVASFHRWTCEHYSDFWAQIIKVCRIQLQRPYTTIVDLDAGIEAPVWLEGAKMNIADSCFQATDSTTAIICKTGQSQLSTMSYAELDRLSNQVANGLITQGFRPGDAIGIIMPMHIEAIAIYLGIIKMGGKVVSIADSFSKDEIATRLHIADITAVFTQDHVDWAGKQLALLPKVLSACNTLATPCKIIAIQMNTATDLPSQVQNLQTFLSNNDQFDAYAADPMDACHILFSSGTTAAPKAIVWNHTTPIKVAADAYFHQNIQAGDVLCWPTNLGWMMGPWLIYAALIHKATIALYPDAPKDEAFGQFVQDAGVTMLGVVPTLVAAWRKAECMQAFDWSKINVFSSTGECSNPEDMLYLMSLANYKPIIEYCGGTEIGGGYISSTVVQPNYPSVFGTATMGLNFVLLDEHSKPSDTGDVAIIPPSIGLSTTLLNTDHYNVYYHAMPKLHDDIVLRRHGDQLHQLPNHMYSILGRSDDAMNLGGIKVSAGELERVLSVMSEIQELAAIAIKPPHNGPSQLIIYAVSQQNLDKVETMRKMQSLINRQLNPLFKIYDLVFVSDLPRTASNKVMRRTLREQYQQPVA